jgi:hypothetical protein
MHAHTQNKNYESVTQVAATRSFPECTYMEFGKIITTKDLFLC